MLRVQWTREAEQDIRAWHNLDVESELAAIIAAEINAEIDGEILADLRTAVSFPIPITVQNGESLIVRLSMTYPSTPYRKMQVDKDLIKPNWKKEGF